GVTGTLERKAWTTDALVRTPDSPPLFSEPLASPELLPAAAPPPNDPDRLIAEQFAQLQADLVFTLGEMSASAWQTMARVWQVVISGPVMAALALLKRWRWLAISTATHALRV